MKTVLGRLACLVGLHVHHTWDIETRQVGDLTRTTSESTCERCGQESSRPRDFGDW